MMKPFTAALTLTASLVALNAAYAATSANLTVNATVVKNCSITIPSALSFGNYDPIANPTGTNLTASATVSVACTKSTPTTNLFVGMNTGQGSSCPTTSPATTRCMKDSNSNTLGYEIYQPPNNTPGTACAYTSPTAWGNTLATGLALTAPSSAAARTYNICGLIPGGQDIGTTSSGSSYTDTVVATINF